MTLIKQSKGELSLPDIFELQFDDIPPPQYLGLQIDDVPPPLADKIREGGFFLVILYSKSAKLCVFCRLQN